MEILKGKKKTDTSECIFFYFVYIKFKTIAKVETIFAHRG